MTKWDRPTTLNFTYPPTVPVSLFLTCQDSGKPQRDLRGTNFPESLDPHKESAHEARQISGVLFAKGINGVHVSFGKSANLAFFQIDKLYLWGRVIKPE